MRKKVKGTRRRRRLRRRRPVRVCFTRNGRSRSYNNNTQGIIIMACLNTLKQEIRTLESVFPKGHERFQIMSASVDELSCRFVGKNGKKYEIHANITVSIYPTLLIHVPPSSLSYFSASVCLFLLCCCGIASLSVCLDLIYIEEKWVSPEGKRERETDTRRALGLCSAKSVKEGRRHFPSIISRLAPSPLAPSLAFAHGVHGI